MPYVAMWFASQLVDELVKDMKHVWIDHHLALLGEDDRLPFQAPQGYCATPVTDGPS